MEINKDTQLCISIAEKPGSFGTTLHNAGYKALNLNFLYKAFSVSNIEKAIDGVRAFNIRGCSVSMPFKESVIPYLDLLDNSAKNVGAVNSIVNDGNKLTGYNTDIIGLTNSIQQEKINSNFSVLVLGSGGFARAALYALKQLGFHNISVACRSLDRVAELKPIVYFDPINWNQRNEILSDIVINATSIGMTSQSETIPIDLNSIEKSQVIIDAVVSPFRTKLIDTAILSQKKFIPGYKISLEQLIAQFKLYTDIDAPREILELTLKKLINSKN
jgi:shikimate dehydrogenase